MMRKVWGPGGKKTACVLKTDICLAAGKERMSDGGKVKKYTRLESTHDFTALVMSNGC